MTPAKSLSTTIARAVRRGDPQSSRYDDVDIHRGGLVPLDHRLGDRERFQVGRVLLVGDAAHRFRRPAGFGMTSGIQDSHNLGWKLHLVLRGLAGEALLHSYAVERRAVAVN